MNMLKHHYHRNIYLSKHIRMLNILATCILLAMASDVPLGRKSVCMVMHVAGDGMVSTPTPRIDPMEYTVLVR